LRKRQLRLPAGGGGANSGIAPPDSFRVVGGFFAPDPPILTDIVSPAFSEKSRFGNEEIELADDEESLESV
jgi:hypothetical protein